ncbi:TerB family tellurite resistance protein [Maribacter litopenaei]|uniref:TerB family tellurite resistance protein n=1 Tax=Maribacter litopenaei TaxID=2976127 RepID=A0ABY5Y8U3_9FLAO|nr:TerB family tellurite resistance protein [Maribacter litopenaei]UWX55309.1 TerB family tellurite resistance protein [Maribacter litopenaei]
MTFEISEKLAIVKVIDSLIHADGVVHNGEINAFAKLMSLLDFDANFLIQARNPETEQSIAMVRNFSHEKKELLEDLMEEVAKSDGFVHQKEIEMMENVLSSIRLEIKSSKV